MRKYVTILLLFLSLNLRAYDTLQITNNVIGCVNASSYDTQRYILTMAYFYSYFVNKYTQYTNMLVSTSQSGAGLLLDLQSNWPIYGTPIFAFAKYTNGVIPRVFFLNNDNGNYSSNTAYGYDLNIFDQPHSMWNGTATTNEAGFDFPSDAWCLGRILNSSSADGDGGALAGNLAGMNANINSNRAPVDCWNIGKTNGINSNLTDVTGTNWFYAGGHPTPKYALGLLYSFVMGLQLDTNFGSITFNFNAGTVAQSNLWAASGLSQSGNRLIVTNFTASCMPPSWDLENVMSNAIPGNAQARDLFRDAPFFGNVFQWTVACTNMPPGTYNVILDGVLVDIATDTQLAAGRNWATNFFAGTNDPFNWQRLQVLYSIRDMYGVDHITGLNTHGAGENGIYGPDLINYQSNATAQWNAGKRGTNLVNALTTWTLSLWNYAQTNRLKAQQVPHTLEIVLNQPRYAPFRIAGQFMNGTNFPASDEWTNEWAFRLEGTTNLFKPNWMPVPATVKKVKGHLGFVVSNAASEMYCRAVYQLK